MSTSELVVEHHLSRTAIIYIRQSSPHQVLTNQESLRLQYALRQRAQALGWRPEAIEIIDTDLGLSGAEAQHREGFKELLARLSLGQVGIILSSEVTRLSRNCSDWYPLLDLCGYKGCLIADCDGVYDPATPNGRLLLGLKGQISELELHTLRARLTAGLLNKAKRGELALTLPAGLIRDASGVVHKTPDMEVQSRINLIFMTFLQVRSASQVVRVFNDQALLIPRRGPFGDVVWKKPTISAILSILKHPAYAGAFVYGRTRSIRSGPPPGKASIKRLPIEAWRIRVNDKYPAYITWQTYEQIRDMLRDNLAEYDRNKTRGIPRPGAALLHGIVYCGECGHKMVVQYKGGNHYLCNHLRQQYRVPVCQYIPADPIDAQVIQAFFKALSPVELNAYERAMVTQTKAQAQIERAHLQQIERLRYQAALAQRQYNQVDPDNRLVAAELERRWENALRDLKQAEDAHATRQISEIPPALNAQLKTSFCDIGKQLPELWHSEKLSRTQKKALLRCLIDKVVIHRAVRDQIHSRIIWKGGDTTTLQIPIPVGSFSELSNAQVLEQQILSLTGQGYSDTEIAERLSDKGFRSPMRNDLLPSTVKGIRLKHRIFRKRSQSHPRHIPGYLTVPQLAQTLEISKHWIYDRIHNGTITISLDQDTGLYLFPDQPSTLEQFKQLKNGKLYNLRY
jgi:DNA invertase Pin-like site-specific DNA recombinase